MIRRQVGSVNLVDMEVDERRGPETSNRRTDGHSYRSTDENENQPQDERMAGDREHNAVVDDWGYYVDFAEPLKDNFHSSPNL